MTASGTFPAFPRPLSAGEYRPFPNETGRNWRQEHLEIPVMLHALDVPQGLIVLEVGCGRGVALPVFWRLLEPARLIGLDIDAGFLCEAATAAGEAGVPAELELGDVRALPFPDRSIDLCIDFGTLYHIRRPEQGLAEIARVVRPGGMVITETRLSQLLSHPVRSWGRRIPWAKAPRLVRDRYALLWQSHRVAS